jgi:hypothetical protein
MLVQIYYQDFKENVNFHFNDACLFYEPDSAEHVATFRMDGEKQEVADRCFWELNNNLPTDMVHVARFNSIGHSSMSVGDYIVFPDGEIWICKSRGWLKWTCPECNSSLCRKNH